MYKIRFGRKRIITSINELNVNAARLGISRDLFSYGENIRVSIKIIYSIKTNLFLKIISFYKHLNRTDKGLNLSGESQEEIEKFIPFYVGLTACNQCILIDQYTYARNYRKFNSNWRVTQLKK